MSAKDPTTADASEERSDTGAGDDVSASGDVDAAPKVLMENITKQFGRVVAVDDVTLGIKDNEIFGLIGDNGAGKSTLMKILSGVFQPTRGQIYYEGTAVKFSNPNDARSLGIETVYQDLALMDDLDIAQNIYLGKFPTKSYGPIEVIDWDRAYEEAERVMSESLNQDLDVRSEVSFLSGGERQLVAIARSMVFDPEVLILDEPTSALSVDATELVHDTVRQVKQQGYTQIIISHNIDEVLEIADRIGVLYQGELAAVVDPEGVTSDDLGSLISTGSY